MSKTERELIEAIKAELDKSAESLDAHTLSRLNQARHRALERRTRFSWKVNRWLLPAAATAAVAVLAFNLLTITPPAEPETLLEDLELLSSVEDMDFYGELEFYEWLDQHAG